MAVLLGQAMAAVALMASTLKFDGNLILQIQGDGPVGLLMAECNDRGELRAIARYDEERQLAGLPWTGLTGAGQLVLTIDPEQGERYQGIVPLEGETLGDALGHYFLQSEQLPTRFWLFADGVAAGGLMLQVLPGHDAGADDDIWPRVTNLASTLKAEEALGLEAEDVLYRLYHEELVELFEPRELRFHCSCSRERSESALRSIEPGELRAIVEEQGGNIEVDCQFCGRRYLFDRVDVESLVHEGQHGPDSLQ